VLFEYPNGKATCVDGLVHFSSSEQSAWSATQSCLAAAVCNDLNKLQAATIYASGPSQCVAGCFHSAYLTGYEEQSRTYNKCSFSGSSGSSAVLLPSVVAIIALILAALL
jgi:hypothetical protein